MAEELGVGDLHRSLRGSLLPAHQASEEAVAAARQALRAALRAAWSGEALRCGAAGCGCGLWAAGRVLWDALCALRLCAVVCVSWMVGCGVSVGCCCALCAARCGLCAGLLWAVRCAHPCSWQRSRLPVAGWPDCWLGCGSAGGECVRHGAHSHSPSPPTTRVHTPLASPGLTHACALCLPSPPVLPPTSPSPPCRLPIPPCIAAPAPPAPAPPRLPHPHPQARRGAGQVRRPAGRAALLRPGSGSRPRQRRRPGGAGGCPRQPGAVAAGLGWA